MSFEPIHVQNLDETRNSYEIWDAASLTRVVVGGELYPELRAAGKRAESVWKKRESEKDINERVVADASEEAQMNNKCLHLQFFTIQTV